jgi:5-methylcytosine-specific restriction protein A
MAKSPPKARRTSAPQPARKQWQTPSKGKRLTGSANQKARRALFRREPLCRECLKTGRVTAAAIRDHITPIAFGGAEHPDNEQPLCKPCHDAKSRAEQIEGKRRMPGGG